MTEKTDAPMVRPPGIPLNRFQLTAMLVGIPTFFVLLALGLSLTGTVRPEPKLNASIRISSEAWSLPNAKESDVRLYVSVVLNNPTEDRWRNVAISINKQFYHYSHLPLEPNQSLTVPLEHFVTKGGNITFRPASQTVSRLTVFAQLPNGERAVYDELVSPPPH